MKRKTISTFLISSIILAGCSTGQLTVPSPIQATPTDFATSAPTPTAATNVEVETREAAPTTGLRTLSICVGSQPPSLYPYGDQGPAVDNILAAVYDGPIDNHSFGYQPVILEKLPSLAEGDAAIQRVSVQEGDLILDNEGSLISLSSGDVIRPAGCQSPECAVTYQGGQIEMDIMIVTFTLLENLRWSDGEPLTARDSVYSYRLSANPDTPFNRFKFVGQRTASYEDLDERTTRWIGRPGFLDQTYFLNFWTPYPEHLWGKYTASELLEAELAVERPVGWGPYVINEWIIDKQIVLSRNPNYFRAEEGLPRFDLLIFRFVTQDPETNLSALLNGTCDVIDRHASYFFDESELFSHLQAEGKITAHFAPTRRLEYFVFSLQPSETWQGLSATGAFQDVRFRQAVALCLDRRRVADEVFEGQSIVPESYFLPMHPLFNPDLSTYPYDQLAGFALLDEIGWVDADQDAATPRIYQGDDERIPQGTALAFHYWITAFEERKESAQILLESLANCGIEAELQEWGAEELFSKTPETPVSSRQFDVVQFSIFTSELSLCDLWVTENIPGDPALLDGNGNPIYPMGWSGLNVSGFSSPEYDQACRSALSLLPGQPGYIQAQQTPQEIFARELPVIPLFSGMQLAVTRPDMCGFIMEPTIPGEMWNIEAFDYGPDCQ